MRVAIYAIALNEEIEVEGWMEGTRDADCRIVLDTGSTDQTAQHLERLGATVHRGTIKPWRFDDALNAALSLVPSDVDVCFRLDLDDRPRPGWRAALERAWKPDTVNLIYPYQWSRAKRYYERRIHSRFGFRWTGPTHELLLWRGQGERSTATCDDLIVDHFPRNKERPDDMVLLKEGVTEDRGSPHRAFLYAHALISAGNLQEGLSELARYVTLGGASDLIAFLWRQVALVDEMNAFQHLLESQRVHPSASNHLALAEQYFLRQEWGHCYTSCQYALSMMRSNPQRVPAWADDPRLRGPKLHDLAATSAWNLWDFEAALGHAVEAVRRAPEDPTLIASLNAIQAKIRDGATLDPNMENTHSEPPAPRLTEPFEEAALVDFATEETAIEATS